MEHESIKPDIIRFSKGIASGFPLGGIIAGEEVMDWEAGSHGSTFGGNPIAAAAGLATLNVIEEENLLIRAERTGRYIVKRLNEFQSEYGAISDVWGRGLMIAFELVKNERSKKPHRQLRNRIIQEAFEAGLLLLPCGPSAIRIVPALNITHGHLDEGLELLMQVLDTVNA